MLLFLAVLQLEVMILPALATMPVPDDRLTAGLIAQGAMLLVAALVAGWALLRWADHQPMRALGFGLSRRIPRELGLGLLIGTTALIGPVLALTAFGAFDYRAEPGTVAGWTAVAGSSLLWLLIPAAAEEAVFRGYPFRALLRGAGPVAAIGITSAVFALVHGHNPNVAPIGLVNIGLAGVMLGVAVYRTGSLWFATALHLGWNWAIAGLLDLPVSGLDPFDPPLYDVAAEGPAWLTGGPFGPEGGFVATLALALVMVWIWLFTRHGQPLAGRAERGGVEGVHDR